MHALIPLFNKEDVGEKKLHRLIRDHVEETKTRIKSAIEITAPDGRHLFTWRKDSNGERAITFPKNIRKFLDFDALQESIVKNILNQCNKKIKEGNAIE